MVFAVKGGHDEIIINLRLLGKTQPGFPVFSLLFLLQDPAKERISGKTILADAIGLNNIAGQKKCFARGFPAYTDIGQKTVVSESDNQNAVTAHLDGAVCIQKTAGILGDRKTQSFQ